MNNFQLSFIIIHIFFNWEFVFGEEPEKNPLRVDCNTLRIGQYLCPDPAYNHIDPKTQQPRGCTKENKAKGIHLSLPYLIIYSFLFYSNFILPYVLASRCFCLVFLTYFKNGLKYFNKQKLSEMTMSRATNKGCILFLEKMII